MLNIFSRVKHLISKSLLIKRVSSLVVGTGVSQIFSLMALVVAARLFSPSKIGVFQVMISFATLFNTFSLLSYQYSLPGLDKKKTGGLIYGMLLILITVVFGGFIFFSLTSYQERIPVLLLIIAYALVALSEQISIRDARIYRIAFFRILRPICFFAYLCFFVRDHRSLSYLIFGFVLINLFFSLILFFLSIKGYRFSFAPIWKNLLEKRKNAFLLTPSELINGLCYNLPVIMIAHYMSHFYAGQYGVVIKICFAPLLLLGSSVGQVFHGDIAAIIRHKRAGGYQRFLMLSKYCFFLGLFVFVALFFIFPLLIHLLLHGDWSIAGHFSQLLAPLFGVMTFVSPMTVLFYLYDEQSFFFLSQLLYLIVTLISFSTGIFFKNIYLAVFLYSFLGILRYVFIWKKVHQIALQLKRV